MGVPPAPGWPRLWGLLARTCGTPRPIYLLSDSPDSVRLEPRRAGALAASGHVRETMAGVGVDPNAPLPPPPGRGGSGLPPPPPLPGPPGAGGAAGGGALLLAMLASGARLTADQIKELAKHDKKAAKRAKKEAKKVCACAWDVDVHGGQGLCLSGDGQMRKKMRLGRVEGGGLICRWRWPGGLTPFLYCCAP